MTWVSSSGSGRPELGRNELMALVRSLVELQDGQKLDRDNDGPV